MKNKSGRPSKIADLEAKIEEIEAAMLENASDYGQLATLQRDLDAANEPYLKSMNAMSI